MILLEEVHKPVNPVDLLHWSEQRVSPALGCCSLPPHSQAFTFLQELDVLKFCLSSQKYLDSTKQMFSPAQCYAIFGNTKGVIFKSCPWVPKLCSLKHYLFYCQFVKEIHKIVFPRYSEVTWKCPLCYNMKLC